MSPALLWRTSSSPWRLPNNRLESRPIRVPLTLTVLTLAVTPTIAHANTIDDSKYVESVINAQLGDRISPQRQKVVKRLDAGLHGTPMRDTGRELEAAGWKHGVSPFFIAAIAATESSLGEEACNGNPRNAFGLSSCGDGWYVPYFRSWAHAYDFMGRFLTERWPDAQTTYDYHGYAACSPCWGRKTAFHMRELFGLPATVKYGG